MVTDIDFSNGFLPAIDPLKALPPSFMAWEEIAAHLPKLLLSNQFKENIEHCPAFPTNLLKSTAEQERAMLILSFLGHAYVWGSPQLATTIPAILAKPWYTLALTLDRPPVLSYASYALHNWYRIDQQRPIELGNIALLQNFLGGVDEEWFILIHVEIEAKASSALKAIIPLTAAIHNKDPQLSLKYLKNIAAALHAICTTLDRMPERCDPYIYYNRVRPYIHGWKNNPALPNGLIYETCYNNQPQFFRGETGAQSTIIPTLDAIFGITHQEDELSAYLIEMRIYMPSSHRAFLSQCEATISIRNYIMQEHHKSPELREVYNSCIDLIVRFRLTHLKYAASYIQKQSQHTSANPTTLGTGGTPFMSYLLKHEKEAELFKI